MRVLVCLIGWILCEKTFPYFNENSRVTDTTLAVDVLTFTAGAMATAIKIHHMPGSATHLYSWQAANTAVNGAELLPPVPSPTAKDTETVLRNSQTLLAQTFSPCVQ